MWKLLKDFKEALCPSTEVKDMKNKLQLAFNESLKVKEMHIEELKSEVEELKKRKECCWCKSDSNLTPFCKRLWDLKGYPSYYYCSTKECRNNYISQLEGIL